MTTPRSEPATAPRIRPRDELNDLVGYHSPQLDVPVRLNTNESPYPPPAAFVAAWTDALRKVPLHRYPDRGTHALRDALGDALGQPPTRLFCANGSNEVLQTLLLTYGGPGRQALVFEPTYALHSHIARVTATPVRSAGRGEGSRVDLPDAERLVAEHHPDVVFLCSPNNPTGVVEPTATIEGLASAVAATGGLLVVDEAYGEFSQRSAVELVERDLPVVVVRTYSKVWSLAALRLGYAVAPEWLVAQLEEVVLPYRLSAASQLAGILALEHREAMRERVDALVSERERIEAALAATPGIEPFPSGANFVLFRIAGDGHALWSALVDRGVLVRDFSRRAQTAECLRVTVGTPSENDAFLTALAAALPEVLR